MRKVEVDRHQRCNFYEQIDGRRTLVASLIFRYAQGLKLEIPQTCHSMTDAYGNFSIYLSQEVITEMGEVLSGVSYERGRWSNVTK